LAPRHRRVGRPARPTGRDAVRVQSLVADCSDTAVHRNRVVDGSRRGARLEDERGGGTGGSCLDPRRRHRHRFAADDRWVAEPSSVVLHDTVLSRSTPMIEVTPMVEVAPLRAADRDAWESLARGYHEFYHEQFPIDRYEQV